MNAGDHRLQWNDVPAPVRADIERPLGATVVEAVGQRGGYGPSLAARCRLADGRRVFIKAVSPAQNPDTPAMMRREANINGWLPAAAPAPELLHVFDDGDWIALVFEDVEGALPANPWDPSELQLVIDASVRLGKLVPSSGHVTVAQQYGAMFVGWRTLEREGPDAVVDPWCRARLDALAATEADWERVSAGDRLIHGDLRSDNVILTPDERVMLVDWTSTCVGAGWFDLVAMLPAAELEGAGSPESVLARAGLDDLGTETLLPMVAAFAGYFAERVRLPDPPGLPTLRAFQRAQGEVATAWLKRLWDRG